MRLRLVCYALGIAVIGSIGLGAQGSDVRSKTTTKVKDGQSITTTGCINRTTDGRYALTSVGGATEYMLVGSDSLAKHVGQRVQISGKATDLGNAKVRTETKTITDREHGKDEESHVTSEQKGYVPGLPMLGVKSVKVLARSCA